VSDLWLPTEPGVPESDKVRVARRAGLQFGRVTRAQLLALGVQDRTVTKWAASDYLFPELPRVYAVGHPGRTPESDLFSAVLYAGPGAALCGLTAALWRGLVKWQTQQAIQVSTPRRCRSLPADHEGNRLHRTIAVRDRRPSTRRVYHRIPTIPVPNIALEIAATGELQLVRFVLAQMDYMRILNDRGLQRLCGRGVPGSSVLTEALGRPQPLFARARSKFEVKLIEVCEETDIPLPETNEKIAGITPDAVWWDQMVIVQCDGERNHGTWRQRKRDATEDVILRNLGFQIVRYVYEQLNDPWAIHADLMPILIERAGRGVSGLSALPG
jgi:hypothetical protein